MRDQDPPRMASQVMRRGSIGEYQGEEDDGEWSGSDGNEISPDTSDPDSD